MDLSEKTKMLDTPSRKWEMDELSNSSLMEDMVVQSMLGYGQQLTRENYLANNYGIDITEKEVPEEIEMYLPWDFQDPENRIPWEETEETTIRDLQEYGLI